MSFFSGGNSTGSGKQALSSQQMAAFAEAPNQAASQTPTQTAAEEQLFAINRLVPSQQARVKRLREVFAKRKAEINIRRRQPGRSQTIISGGDSGSLLGGKS